MRIFFHNSFRGTGRCVAAAAWLAVLAGTARAEVVTIEWYAQDPGAALGDSTGQELLPGRLVRLGWFVASGGAVLSPSEVEAIGADGDALENAFVELSREVIGRFGGARHLSGGSSTPGFDTGESGVFSQQLTLDSAIYGGGIANRRLYIFAGGRDDGEAGIFSHPDWRVPAVALPALLCSVAEVMPGETGHVYIGQRGPQTSPTLSGLLNMLVDLSSSTPDDMMADVDGDGSTALLEDAFGMDRTAPDPQLLPEGVVASDETGKRAGIRFRRRTGGDSAAATGYLAAGLRYDIEVCGDLTGWRDADPSELTLISEGTDPLGIETVVVLLSEPLSGGPNARYLRVRISTAP